MIARVENYAEVLTLLLIRMHDTTYINRNHLSLVLNHKHLNT